MTLSLDSETSGLNLLKRDRPFIISAFNDADESALLWVWSVDPHTRQPSIPAVDLDEIAHYIEGQEIVFHNAVFDLRALASIGLCLSFTAPVTMSFSPGRNHTAKVRNVKCSALHDTQLLSHCANNEGASGLHDLKSLSLNYLDYTADDERELRKATIAARRLGKKLGWSLGVNHKGEAEVEADYWMPRALWGEFDDLRRSDGAEASIAEIPDAWETICQDYALGDVERTLALYHFLTEILDSEGLRENYEREVRLVPVTYNMEQRGFHVSKKYLHEELSRFESASSNCGRNAVRIIKEFTGRDEEINIDSGQQLASFLINDAKLAPVKLTGGGNISTNADAIHGIAQYVECHPTFDTRIAEALRCIVGYDPEKGDDKKQPGYRTYNSAVKYLRGYQQLLDGSYIHSSYNQSGTKFTRYSCTRPNSQNVSKKAVIPLRRVFSPPPGYLWLDMDYSQLELRIFAYAAEDESMIAAFNRGEDFHEFTACEMYGLLPGEVSKEQRRNAKAVNFKAIYGGLKNVPAVYGERFPAAHDFMKRVESQVHQFGYVVTRQGDRIYIDPEKAYVGVDAICQGTAGRIMKEAMRMIHEMEVVDWQGSGIIANIHDSILTEVSKSYPIGPIAKRIKNIMELAGQQAGVVTPVDTDIITDNWAEPIKFESTSLKELKPNLRKKTA